MYLLWHFICSVVIKHLALLSFYGYLLAFTYLWMLTVPAYAGCADVLRVLHSIPAAALNPTSFASTVSYLNQMHSSMCTTTMSSSNFLQLRKEQYTCWSRMTVSTIGVSTVAQALFSLKDWSAKCIWKQEKVSVKATMAVIIAMLINAHCKIKVCLEVSTVGGDG